MTMSGWNVCCCHGDIQDENNYKQVVYRFIGDYSHLTRGLTTEETLTVGKPCH